MAYDAARNQVVLFGGNSNGAILNDTWVWDGTNWTQKSPAASPPPTAGAAMVYDAGHSQIVLFGGSDNTQVYNDTWVWNGVTWTKKTPVNRPTARANHAMAYDAARGQVVLFAGGGEVTLNDTWIWDGSNWTQLSPAISPTARTHFALAFDAARSEVILFGGRDVKSADITKNDTWSWNGATWTQKSPATSPPRRQTHAMAYDAALSKIVLFGGDAFNFNPLNDTWTWDGSTWAGVTTQNSPSPRTEMALAYDAAHSQVVLFGGGAGFATNVTGDTWTFSGSAASGPNVAAVINASAFGGGTTVAPGSWVEIYGTGLASTTRQWGGADFSGNNAPTSLDGVQVSIGGQKAFVDYVSTAGQVNAQLPSNIATGGTLPLTITFNGATSAAVNVPVKPTAAALLAPSSFLINGKQYLVALFSDNVTYVLPPGAIPGVASRQAHPGETIVTYGIGFGGVTPDTPAGLIATQATKLTQSLQIQFGQTPAQVTYQGLAPGFVGLYQFNIVVPSVPDNDLTPVTFNLGGGPGTQTLYLAVHQ